MKTIPIFFAFNNDYVIPAAVAFWSLQNKAKENIYYDMYVLHSDITEENQKLLLDIVKKRTNAKLNFINTNGFLDDNWKTGNFEVKNAGSKFTGDVIVRCFASKFFPQFEKIIYSDVDIVISDDISELYEIDLEGKYIAGVKNPFIKWNSNELSHLKPEHYEMLKDSYIAGGIWVMNLKQIRKDNLEKRMLEIIEDNTFVKRWPDQDIINISCENKVVFLPLNYIGYPYLNDILLKPDFISHYSREELYDSIINPKIIHYAAQKPWNSRPKMSEYWWDIYNYLNLPRTQIFDIKNKFSVKKRTKNIINALLLIIMQIPILDLIFNDKTKNKIYKAIEKYR